MLRVGDDAAGFSVDFPEAGGTLVRGWGFWSAQVAKAFGNDVIAACRRKGLGCALVLDMGDLKPMRDEGQRSFSEILHSLPSLAISRASIVTTNPLTKLQLIRLVAESGAEASVEWVSTTNRASRDG